MEVMIDWSSSCGLVSDSRKRMQQVVSEPSILGGERRLESQQLNARLEEIANSLREFQREQKAQWQELKTQLKAELKSEFKKIYQDLCLADEDLVMETTDASSSSCKSQLELPKFAGNVEFQNSSDFDGREPSEVADDGVEHLISVRHEEIDMELEFGKFESCETTNKFMIMKESSGVTNYLKVENSVGVNETEVVEFEFPKRIDFLKSVRPRKNVVLPPARENASLEKLVVMFPSPVHCHFSLKWLSDWDHKPKVKMKCRVDCVEFYSKFSHHYNSVSLGLLWRCASKLEASISLVTSIFSQDFFSEIFDTGSSRHGRDPIGGVVEQLRGVVEEESMMLGKDAIGNFEEFGKYSNFSLQFCLDAKRKTFTPKDVQVPEQDGKDNRDIFILEIGILVGKKHGGKREEDPLHGDMSFDRCFCSDEGIEQLEQLGSLCNHYLCQGRFYIDEGLERVEKLETLFVKVDHLFRYNFQLKPLWILVRIRFWTKTGPWLESSLIRTFHLGCLHFALFLLTMTCFLPSLRTRKLTGGSVDTITIAWLMGGDEAYGVCWQSLAKELETGESTLRLTHKCLLIIAFDILMIVLRWIRERSVARLLEASVRSNGQIRSASEAAGEREQVLCLKRLLVVQSHYLGSGCSLGSLGRLVFVIPCGQGILRGMNCYGHKL